MARWLPALWMKSTLKGLIKMSKELVVMGDKYLVDSCDGTVQSVTVQTTTHTYHQGLQTLQIGNVIYVTPEHFVPYSQETVYSLALNADDGRHLLFQFTSNIPLSSGERITMGWGGKSGNKAVRPVYIIRHNPLYLFSITNFVEGPVVVLKIIFQKTIGRILLFLFFLTLYGCFTIDDTQAKGLIFSLMALDLLVIALWSFIQYIRNMNAVLRFNKEILQDVKARLGLA